MDSILEAYGRALGSRCLMRILHQCSDPQPLVMTTGMMSGASALPLCCRRQLCQSTCLSPTVVKSRQVIKPSGDFSSFKTTTPAQPHLKQWVLVSASGTSVLSDQLGDEQRPQIIAKIGKKMNVQDRPRGRGKHKLV